MVLWCDLMGGGGEILGAGVVGILVGNDVGEKLHKGPKWLEQWIV